jgi:hypothetical protein
VNGDSPLNIQPRGLLDFFGVKQGGWGPRIITPTLQPQLDLWRHYVGANGDDVEGSTAAFAGVQNVFRQFLPITWLLPSFTLGVLPNPIPQTELWYLDVWSFDATVTVGAGSRIVAVQLAVRFNNSTQLLQLPTTTSGPLTIDATAEGAIYGSLLYPVFLKPGSELGILLAGNVAAGETFTARSTARVARMRV